MNLSHLPPQIGMWFDQRQCRQPLRWSEARVVTAPTIDDQAVAVLHQCVAYQTQPRLRRPVLCNRDGHRGRWSRHAFVAAAFATEVTRAIAAGSGRTSEGRTGQPQPGRYAAARRNSRVWRSSSSRCAFIARYSFDVDRRSALFGDPAGSGVNSPTAASRQAGDDLLDLGRQFHARFWPATRRWRGPAIAWIARFERAIPTAPAIVLMACRRARAKVRATTVLVAPDPAPRAEARSPMSSCRAAAGAYEPGSAGPSTRTSVSAPRRRTAESAPSA